MLQRVVTILSLTMFCALACGSSTDCNANASPNPKDDPIAIVQKYVATHRTWKTTDYKISEDHKETRLPSIWFSICLTRRSGIQVPDSHSSPTTPKDSHSRQGNAVPVTAYRDDIAFERVIIAPCESRFFRLFCFSRESAR